MKFARRLDRAKASGPSGLGNAHLRILLSADDDLAGHMAGYFNLIRAGRVGERVRRLIVAGAGIPLPQGGKIRPIVVPSATLRLIGRVDMRRLRGKFEKYFLHTHDRVRQYAVGVEQGGELMFRRIADTLTKYPHLLAVSNDAKKAFQNFDRAPMWDLLEREFPELATLVRFTYGVESAIVLRDADLGDPIIVLNAVGARQGCPLGTMLYALVQHPLLVEVAEAYDTLEVDAFADDVTFTAAPPVACAANALYKHLYTLRLNGELNDAKSSAISFGVTEAEARAAGLNENIPWMQAELPDGSVAEGGVILYGGPIGTPAFVRAFLQAAVDTTATSFRRLALMERRQDRLIMLRQSLSKKLQHVQRLVPTHEHADILRAYDDQLQLAVQTLTFGKGAFTEHAADLVSLPASLGGLGIESAVQRADAAYYSSFHTANLRLSTLCPAWAASCYDEAHPAAAAYRLALGRLLAHPGMAELLGRVTVQDRPLRLQGKIMLLLQALRHERLARSLPDVQATVLHASAQAPHLVSITATSDPGLVLSDDVLSTALAQRLSLTQIPSSFTDAAETKTSCPSCGKSHITPYLTDAITCYDRGNRSRTAWHDGVLRVLHAIVLACGHQATVEPPGVASDSARRTDLRIPGLLPGGATVWVDVRTYCRSRGKTSRDEAAFPGTLCDTFEAAKVRHHLPAIRANNPADAFYAFVLDEHGAIGPQGLDLLDLLFTKAAKGSSVALKTYWMRRLAVVTARRVHAILFGQVRGFTRSKAPAHQPAADDVDGQTQCAQDVDDGGGGAAPPPAAGAAGAPGAPAHRAGGRVAVDDAMDGHMRLADADDAGLAAAGAAAAAAEAAAGGGAADAADAYSLFDQDSLFDRDLLIDRNHMSECVCENPGCS